MSDIKKPPHYKSIDDMFDQMGYPIKHVRTHVRSHGTEDEETLFNLADQSVLAFKSRWKKPIEKFTPLSVIFTVILKIKEIKIAKVETKIKKKVARSETVRKSDLDTTAALIKKRDRLQNEITELKCKKKKSR